MKKIKNWLKIGLVPILLVFGTSAFAPAPNNGKYFEIAKNLEIFTNLYKELNTHYVDDLDPGELMRIGMDAMMDALDPYTIYYSEQQIEGYRFITEGKFKGIGAKIDKVNGVLTILSTSEKQPAFEAGLKAGDKILAVDGNDTQGKSKDDLRSFLQGVPGSTVALTIERPGAFKKKEIIVTRAEVEVNNVPYFGMLNDNIGYVILTTFTANAGKNIADAVNKLKDENPNMKGLVFDLRNNGGGLLREAVNICNLFIPKDKLVVSTKGKVKDWDKSYETRQMPLDKDLPIAVLINKSSASASEIVSGVLQDYDRGVLIGQRSYGKGLVQNHRDIGYNSRMKLTTAKYYIPSGRCIQGVEYKDGEPVDIPESRRAAFKTINGRTVYDGGGIKPDIILKSTDNEQVIKALVKDFYIFNFVTDYISGKESIGDVENYKFTDWDNFRSFLKKADFDYKTESEKLLLQLEDKVKEEDMFHKMNSQISTLKNTIEDEKDKALESFKFEIIDLIEKEIAARYFYEEGAIKIGLRNDKEIKDAIDLLNDTKKYNKILSN